MELFIRNDSYLCISNGRHSELFLDDDRLDVLDFIDNRYGCSLWSLDFMFSNEKGFLYDPDYKTWKNKT